MRRRKENKESNIYTLKKKTNRDSEEVKWYRKHKKQIFVEKFYLFDEYTQNR